MFITLTAKKGESGNLFIFVLFHPIMYQGRIFLFTIPKAFLIAGLLVIVLHMNGFSQKPNTDPTGDEKWARAYMMAGDFVAGLKEYLLLIRKDSANPEYNYNLATCYLNTNIDKVKAIPYLEFAATHPKMDPIVYYDLGRAYQYAYRFDDAIEAYQKYKKLLTGEDPNYISADMQIDMCERATEMLQNPVNVTFENLGHRINSPFPDFNPYVTRNENTLYFTSKRSGNIGNILDYDGYHTSDMFIVENKYGTWDKAKRLPPSMNTPLVEETAGLSSDGNYMFAFVDNLDARFQLRYSRKTSKSFQFLHSMGININPKDQGATAATISRDKKTLIFAADRSGGYGGSDLYMAKALPNGEWGIPANLGPVINTTFDEEYPMLSFDGSRLYFSSVGHGSMGGYDLYYSDWDTASANWGQPVNLGYPVNTPDDDMQISFTASGRYAYKAALRPEGYGNLDIYRITFHDVEPAYTVVRGYILEKDSISVFDAFRAGINMQLDTLRLALDSAYRVLHAVSDSAYATLRTEIARLEDSLAQGPVVNISVFEIPGNQSFGKYKPNPKSGRYAIALSPGKFQIVLRSHGYQDFITDIAVPDREMNIKEIDMNIKLNRLQ
jgi:tetratricopeptide (TPR) repeat protein